MYTNKYRLSHLEQVNEAKKAWKNNNREKINKRASELYLANIEYNREKERKRHEKYKIQKSLRERQRRLENPEKERIRHLLYDQQNPEKKRDRQHRRRARERNAIVEIFNSVEIFERDRWICQLCKKKVNRKRKHPDPLSPSLDHIIPLAQGGTHERKNVQLTHLICNQMASTRGKKQLRII